MLQITEGRKQTPAVWADSVGRSASGMEYVGKSVCVVSPVSRYHSQQASVKCSVAVEDDVLLSIVDSRTSSNLRGGECHILYYGP